MASILGVPNFVKAASPLGLRRFMYQVQLKDSMQYNFFDISFVDGFWFAWYYHSPKSDTEKLEAAKQLTTKEI